MAKKFTSPAPAQNVTPVTKPVTRAIAASATITSPVRNSPIPKVQGAATGKKEISREQIAKRAYEIWRSGTGGSELDNWHRAIRELGG
jgi:hypothetical protein